MEVSPSTAYNVEIRAVEKGELRFAGNQPIIARAKFDPTITPPAQTDEPAWPHGRAYYYRQGGLVRKKVSANEI